MLVQVPNKSTLFGPMQTDPASIREKLFTGIDGEYNVTDMDVVFEVIGQLESFQISREELEATRLGKHINELRRKAGENRTLATRAKNLIKKWKSLLPSAPAQGPPPGGGTNGHHVTTNGRHHPTVSPRLPPVSPRLAASRTPSNPRTPLVSPALPRTPLVSPRLCPVSPRGRSVRPVPPSPVLSKSGVGTGTRTSPVLIDIGSSTSTSPSHTASRPASPLTVELESPRPPSRSPSPEIIMVKSSPVKRARPREESPEIEVIQEPQPKRAKVEKLVNGDRELSSGRRSPPKEKLQKPVRRKVPPRTPKTDTPDILNQQMAKALQAGRGRVRTTQELVQNLGIDSRAASISPPNCRPVTDLVPKENQDQLMDRFFLSQQEAVDRSRPSTAASELTVGSSEVTSAEPSRGPTPQAVETVEDLLAKLPPIDPSAVLEEWRQQEAEEEEEVEGLIPVLRPRTELTQQLIEDLNNGQLEHIGGIKDHEGEFKEWHQMTSLVSKDGELLHILPYSVID